jgi:hypothetical protein
MKVPIISIKEKPYNRSYQIQGVVRKFIGDLDL